MKLMEITVPSGLSGSLGNSGSLSPGLIFLEFSNSISETVTSTVPAKH